jgi:hypothetical protein
MLLAGILALSMLSAVPDPGRASGEAASAATYNFVSSPLQSSSQSPPTTQNPSSQQTPPPADQPSPVPAPKHKHKKKPTPAADPSTPAAKKVVPHGSTEDSTTHLAPSMTDEQSARTKEANADLLNQATANLQKVSGRPLTTEQQETANQIRKFVEQSKGADQEGDLQRAGTLANKAKLLSDSLEETSRPK